MFKSPAVKMGRIGLNFLVFKDTMLELCDGASVTPPGSIVCLKIVTSCRTMRPVYLVNC